MADILTGARELAWSFRALRDPLLSSFEREIQRGAEDFHRRVKGNVSGGTLKVVTGRLSRSLLRGERWFSRVYEAFVKIGGRITPHTYAHEFGATIRPKGHSHLAIPWNVLRSGGAPRYYSPIQTPAGFLDVKKGASAHLFTAIKKGPKNPFKKKGASLSQPGFQGTPAFGPGEKKLLGFFQGLSKPKGSLSIGPGVKKSFGPVKHVVLKAKWQTEKEGPMAGAFRPTFLVRGRKAGNWVVMFRSTKGAVPIFTLTPQVTLRPRLGFWSSFDASRLHLDRLLPRLGSALERHLRMKASVPSVRQL